MDLSVAIVSWNTSDLLHQCLKSVYETTKGIEFEVIVVDNASSDGSADMVRSKYPQVTLIANSDNAGFAGANNQAFRISHGRHFLMLNPDTVVRGDALKKLAEFLDSNDRAGAVGPLVLNGDGSLQHSWARFPTLWSEAIGRLDRRIEGVTRVSATADEIRALDPFHSDWIGGCCLMMRKEAIEQIGLMDDTFFMYSEETDWCYRLRKTDWGVWVDPRAEIMHYGGKSSEQTSDHAAALLISSKGLFFRKHYGTLSSAAVILLLSCRRSLQRMFRLGVRR